ncbi:MAG: hypothetical protein FJW37_11055, partial [Acidobacteria bacterium]|nr:hypothetical protein [Acidobacteriota bacterium]
GPQAQTFTDDRKPRRNDTRQSHQAEAPSALKTRFHAGSKYNGFQLCLGTTAEGLKEPRTEVLPIVEYLARRGKIHQIHMRNIRGGLHNFAEVFPDEGEMDFLEILRILRDVQFPGALCPDHMPTHPDDPGGLQAFAFGYGYIRALIQAVNSEV